MLDTAQRKSSDSDQHNCEQLTNQSRKWWRSQVRNKEAKTRWCSWSFCWPLWHPPASPLSSSLTGHNAGTARHRRHRFVAIDIIITSFQRHNAPHDSTCLLFSQPNHGFLPFPCFPAPLWRSSGRGWRGWGEDSHLFVNFERNSPKKISRMVLTCKIYEHLEACHQARPLAGGSELVPSQTAPQRKHWQLLGRSVEYYMMYNYCWFAPLCDDCCVCYVNCF